MTYSWGELGFLPYPDGQGIPRLIIDSGFLNMLLNMDMKSDTKKNPRIFNSLNDALERNLSELSFAIDRMFAHFEKGEGGLCSRTYNRLIEAAKTNRVEAFTSFLREHKINIAVKPKQMKFGNLYGVFLDDNENIKIGWTERKIGTRAREFRIASGGHQSPMYGWKNAPASLETHMKRAMRARAASDGFVLEGGSEVFPMSVFQTVWNEFALRIHLANGKFEDGPHGDLRIGVV